MKILFLDAYFRPEITSFTHLEDDLIEGLIDMGHEITVVCPTPTRNVIAGEEAHIKSDKFGKLKVVRFYAPKERKNPLLRAARYFWCGKRQLSAAKRIGEVDAVFSNSTPPTQGLNAAKIAKILGKKYKKKIPFIYNLQDLFPDSLLSAGLTKKGSLIWKIGSRTAKKTYALADAIITVSNGFKKSVVERGVNESKVFVVYNWVDTKKIKPIDKNVNALYGELGIDKTKFNVVYAGNFGASQSVETILQAAKLLEGEKEINFVLFGGGVEFGTISEKVSKSGAKNLRVFPLLSGERVAEVYSLGDVSLITCKKGAGVSAMPSKTVSIMATNSPIIASFDNESELFDVLNKASAGVTVKPENPEALAEKIKEFYSAAKKGNPFISHGREYVIKNADKETCVKVYAQTIENSVISGDGKK